MVTNTYRVVPTAVLGRVTEKIISTKIAAINKL